LRIIAGRHRGTALAAVGQGDAGAQLRPTTDRVRESLFNVLLGGRHGDPITGARVLDLFAGTGALGLEALSRGAAHVTFVENGRIAQRLIHDNIARLRRGDDTRILKGDAMRLPPASAVSDLVFLDPPYGRSLGQQALASALAAGWIADTALIVWEENAPQLAPPGFALIEHRRYSDTHITFLERHS